ncbi:MAG: phytanoyl-CoA dioxygenase family protein [Proteobacteria bacterium]|nr:phytanoyl-CoA dioxygenase family protein [Pseudomonadota bacterium]
MKIALHEWNQGFEWQPCPPERRLLTDEQARAYDEDGFFVLEDAFDAETVARATAAIDPFEAQVEQFLQSREDGRLFIARANAITFTTHLVAKSEVLRDLCRRPPLTDLVHDLIGGDSRLYWDQAVYKKPGTPEPFPWHQDNGYAFVEPQQYLTCWIALTDADESNGCPWVVPGVHRHGTLRHELTDLGWVCSHTEPRKARPVPVRAGSIVVFSSLTPHATGANQSETVRKAYIVQYAPDQAVVLRRGPNGERVEETASDPDRQFFVLRGGVPVTSDEPGQ